MVQVREILEKLSPQLKYGDKIMNYELGDYDFDTFKETSVFTFEFTNSKNPNIKMLIKDDFPFRLVVIDKKEDAIYGTTWNGFKQVKWKKDADGHIESLSD